MLRLATGTLGLNDKKMFKEQQVVSASFHLMDCLSRTVAIDGGDLCSYLAVGISGVSLNSTYPSHIVDKDANVGKPVVIDSVNGYIVGRIPSEDEEDLYLIVLSSGSLCETSAGKVSSCILSSTLDSSCDESDLASGESRKRRKSKISRTMKKNVVCGKKGRSERDVVESRSYEYLTKLQREHCVGDRYLIVDCPRHTEVGGRVRIASSKSLDYTNSEEFRRNVSGAVT